MDWPTLSSIAQIVGTVAVVLTLIYLAWEVRQNTDSIQAAAREATAIGDVEWLYKQLDRPHLTTLFLKSETPTEDEAIQMHAYLVAFLRLKEVNYRHYRSHVMDERTWVNYRSSITDGPLSLPHARSWWLNVGRHLFDQEMSEQITRDLSSAPLLPPFSTFFAPADWAGATAGDARINPAGE